jgi:hypothetical protein
MALHGDSKTLTGILNDKYCNNTKGNLREKNPDSQKFAVI